MSTYEMEVMREVWADKDVSYNYEIGPDRGGCECVELRRREGEDINTRMTFAPEQAILIANAMLATAAELKELKQPGTWKK